MLKRPILMQAVLVASFGLMGCRPQVADSDPPQPATEAPKIDLNPALEPSDMEAIARQEIRDQEPPPLGLSRDTPPDLIVVAFLGALRNGDDGLGAALLTRRAREETGKRGLTVQHLGSPHAEFKIGVPKYLDAQRNGAHVNTTWIENRDNTIVTYDIIWALRRQASGWRVAGMGAPLGPGQPVVYLNFEDPDDMLTKWREAEEAYAASQASDPETRQARSPEPGASFQR